MDRQVRAGCIGLLLIASTACRPSHEMPSALHGAEGIASSVASRLALAPRAPADLPTTDAVIAVGNLDAAIDGGERDLARAPSWERVASLAAFHSERGQYLGILADYDRAAALGDRAVELAPRDGRAYLVRARTRAALHRFADALADLDRADALTRDGTSSDRQRASILQALGQYE